MKIKIHHLTIVLALLAGVHHAAAQGTAFTYQGRLNDAGNPANGTNYGMVFNLFDAPTNGALLGNEGLASVTVSNGLFTVPLDFGAAFDGNPRWLEISVQSNGGGFSTLTPRQQIQPAPYAVFANTASNVSGTVSPSQLSGPLSLAQLPGGIVTNNESSVNLNGVFAGNGSALTNIPLSAVGPAGTFSLLPGYYGPAFTVGVGSQPICVIAADVNGDGMPDLITANGNGTLLVLTNNGSGGFGPNATINAGGQPNCVIAADVNGDGKPDLIAANGNGTLLVLTNNGSGGFGSNATINVGSQPNCVIAADVNGDSKPDLITANVNGTLLVLTNNGSGGFGSNATINISALNQGVGQPLYLTAADVNGDGKPDLISANQGLNQTLIVLTNAGSGGFGYNAMYFLGGPLTGVIAADINGDGKPDLIGATVGYLTVLTNNGSGGFVFDAQLLNAGRGFTSVTAADVNGDGQPDLITANGNDTLVVLTNNGSGGFGSNATLYVGSQPHCVISANVNSAGRPDLISANSGDNTLSIIPTFAGVAASTNVVTFNNSFNTFAGAFFGTFSGNGAGLTQLNYTNIANSPVIPSTNGFVTAAVTNGLATTNFVTSLFTNTVTTANYMFAYDTNSQSGFIFFQGAEFGNLVQTNGWTYSVVNDAGNFTCPQTGLYLIEYNGEATGGTGDTFSMTVIVNAAILPGSQASVYFPTSTGSHPVSLSKSCLASLNAGSVLKLETSGTSPNCHLAPDASVAGSITPSVSLTIVRLQ